MMRRLVLVLLVIALGALSAATGGGPAAAGKRSPASVVNSYSDAQLIDGFMRTVFGAEDPVQNRRANRNRIKKFPGRVRVHIINLAQPDRSAEVRRFLKVLRASVKNLNITETRHEKKAEMIVFLIDRGDYREVIEETLKGMPGQANSLLLRRSACSAVTGGRNGINLDRAFVYIVANEGRRAFRHCMVEEITQSLGPVNDDWRLKDSIFNDSSSVETFAIFDWYLLNMLYDRRVKAGMTPVQVRRVLPAAIADARKRLSTLIANKRIDISR